MPANSDNYIPQFGDYTQQMASGGGQGYQWKPPPGWENPQAMAGGSFTSPYSKYQTLDPKHYQPDPLWSQGLGQFNAPKPYSAWAGGAGMSQQDYWNKNYQGTPYGNFGNPWQGNNLVGYQQSSMPMSQVTLGPQGNPMSGFTPMTTPTMGQKPQYTGGYAGGMIPQGATMGSSAPLQYSAPGFQYQQPQGFQFQPFAGLAYQNPYYGMLK